MDRLRAERDALQREHEELTAAFTQIKNVKPFDAEAHREHVRKLHDHVNRLHAYAERVRGRAPKSK